MAIFPGIPGLSAEVVVDGEPLREYADDEADKEQQPRTVTKYVQVDADALFGVRYTIPKGLDGKRGDWANLEVDGRSVRSHHRSHAGGKVADRDITNCLDTVYSNVDGAKYTQKLRFTKLHIDEELDPDEKIDQQLKQVGVLTLKLSFIDAVTERELPRKSALPHRYGLRETLPVLGKVAEKNLKGDAKSHQAKLETPEFRGLCVPKRKDKEHSTGEPFAIFRFKYRSTSALKSLHVIPSTSSPSDPSQTRRAVDNVKQESTQNGKREANMMGTESEVEFMSSKRLKNLPTSKDEVIVLE